METLLQVLIGILELQAAWVSSQELEQSPQSLIIQEGENFTINCHSSKPVYALHWYRQKNSEGLISLMILWENGEKSHEKTTATLNEKKQQSSLHITASQSSDSGIYFCAADTNNYGSNNLIFGTGTRVTVTPNVQDPDPSVYQMRSPKTGRTVCLFTDFDSQADFQKPEGATVISLNSTVLDMKVMDSKSNGALTWNSETNIECKENFQQPFYPSSNYSCDAKLIEKSFETDMDLNFYNLLVIGLRILLLKVIGFNLFMTLRLWSC